MKTRFVLMARTSFPPYLPALCKKNSLACRSTQRYLFKEFEDVVTSLLFPPLLEPFARARTMDVTPNNSLDEDGRALSVGERSERRFGVNVRQVEEGMLTVVS